MQNAKPRDVTVVVKALFRGDEIALEAEEQDAFIFMLQHEEGVLTHAKKKVQATMIEESRFALMNIEGWRQSWWPCKVSPWLYLMKQMGMYSRVPFYKISHGAQIEPLKNSDSINTTAFLQSPMAP